MIPRNTKLKLAVEGYIGSFLVAFGIIIIYGLISMALSGNTPQGWGTVIGWVSMAFILLGGLLYALAWIFTSWEILWSRKSVLWKVGWLLICFLITGLGIAVYYFWGRKSL